MSTKINSQHSFQMKYERVEIGSLSRNVCRTFSKNQKKTKDLKEALEMTQKEKKVKVGEKDKKHCSFSTLKMDSKAVPN